MKTAIFLGGGASAAEGAPLQTELFREYFKLLCQNQTAKDSGMYQEISAYFKDLFSIDIDHSDLDAIHFPTFEEALGILDLAVRRREALKDFDLENISRNSNRIGFMRQYLVLLLATVLDHNEEKGSLHRQLADELSLRGFLKETFFLTTNYDTLIDKALTNLPAQYLDYGLRFANRTQNSPAHGQSVKLFKVHGSLNWLYCPACNIISLTGDNQGVIRLLTDRRRSECENCGSIILPVIIPPTFFKDMSNVFLNMVWNEVEQNLRQVERIIFCGYSFPDSDLHIKYLLKRAQTNRPDPLSLRFVVINGHPGKNPYMAEKENHRYRRFLGPSVDYTNLSFEDFAAAPQKVYHS